MSKCLNSIELLRAMVDPLNPDNAAIIGHLYVCADCRKELREWREALEYGEYEPQPDNNNAAEAIAKRDIEQANAWKYLFNKCRNFFSKFQDFSKICPVQVAFGFPSHRGTQLRKITESPVFNFQSRGDVSPDYQWRASMTLPIHATITSKIMFSLQFPSLPQGQIAPQTLVFLGQELQITNGSASISCADFLTSAKFGNGEKIYVVFIDDKNTPYHAYGDLVKLTPFERQSRTTRTKSISNQN